MNPLHVTPLHATLATTSTRINMKTLAFILLLALMGGPVHAQDVYKWTDKDGKVHFGDRKSAPSEGRKIDVKVAAPSASPSGQPLPIESFQAAPSSTLQRLPPSPHWPTDEPNKGSVAVSSSRVNPRCLGLAEQIKQVRAGVPWQDLAKDFNATCPGVTYECVTHKRQPERNSCGWVERTGSSMVHTKIYE